MAEEQKDKKLKMHSPDLTPENIEKLAELFPNCVTEARDAEGNLKRAIDFDQLRQELSENVVDGPRERYQLNWPGKREALLASNAPIAKTLRPCREESVDFDTTKNLFIEGDNLDALKLLQESYLNKVQLIYIDPPYNTGSDFIYEDDFADSSVTYMLRSEQRDDSGQRLVANLESNGRFHSDWLSMMYSRLRLARVLLRETGIMLISIDQTELANLRRICDEVFGEDNFSGIYVWEKKKKPSFLNANMGTVTEYVLAYARDRASSPSFAAGKVEDGKKYPFNNAGNPLSVLTFPANSVEFACDDQTIEPQDMSEGNIVTELLDTVTIRNSRNTDAFRLKGEWRYSQKKLDEFVANGAEIRISKAPFRPNYINRSGEIKKTANLLSHRVNGVPTNEDATKEMRSIFGGDVMSHPKPTGLLEYLVRSVTSDDDIVMDFFAGSATTAHAVLNLNAADGGARRYIMVQLEERIDPDAVTSPTARDTARRAVKFLDSIGRPHTIAELAKERLRRASSGSYDSFLGSGRTIDCGFRVLKVDSSNMKSVFYRPEDTSQDLLFGHIDNIKDDRSDEDLLFQVLLDWGVDLSLPISRQNIGGKRVYFVDMDAVAACFATGLDDAFVKELAQRRPLRVVFRDAGYGSDDVKINVEQIFRQLSPGTDVRTL